jgi:hypothetical protein
VFECGEKRKILGAGGSWIVATTMAGVLPAGSGIANEAFGAGQGFETHDRIEQLGNGQGSHQVAGDLPRAVSSTALTIAASRSTAIADLMRAVADRLHFV